MTARRPFEHDEHGNPPPHENPFALASWVLVNCPEKLHLINLAGTVKRVKMARRDGLPAAFVLLDVPGPVGENLKGPPGEQDAYILVHIRREAVDAFDAAAQSRIIVPGRPM